MMTPERHERMALRVRSALARVSALARGGKNTQVAADMASVLADLVDN